MVVDSSSIWMRQVSVVGDMALVVVFGCDRWWSVAGDVALSRPNARWSFGCGRLAGAGGEAALSQRICMREGRSC